MCLWSCSFTIPSRFLLNSLDLYKSPKQEKMTESGASLILEPGAWDDAVSDLIPDRKQQVKVLSGINILTSLASHTQLTPREGTHSFQIMNNSSFTSFELSVLAVPHWLAYSLITVYSLVIILASLGSILIITAVSRTKSNVYIGTLNSYSKCSTNLSIHSSFLPSKNFSNIVSKEKLFKGSICILMCAI